MNTTVLPYASAGAIFHAGIAIGKFHGVISPTTPSGSRVTSTSTPGRTDGSFSPASAQRFAGEELEDLPGAHHLADALGQRLALLARQQPPELVLAREDLGAGAVEDVRALLDRVRSPTPETPAAAAAIAARACAASACAYSPITSLMSDGLRLAVAVAPATHSPAM